MGEVYKAHDPRLKRDVAIEVSAAQFSERFEREAHAGEGRTRLGESSGATTDSCQPWSHGGR